MNRTFNLPSDCDGHFSERFQLTVRIKLVYLQANDIHGVCVVNQRRNHFVMEHINMFTLK